jgi:hypothetical protein
MAKLKVTPNRALRGGPFQSTVQIKLHGNKAEPPLEVRIWVRGSVREAIEATPSTVVFGARSVGKMVSQTIVLASRTGKRFTYVGVEGGSPDITFEPMRGQPEGNQAVSIRQRISRRGAQVTPLRVRVRLEDGSLLRIPVTVTYFGITDEDTPESNSSKLRQSTEKVPGKGI